MDLALIDLPGIIQSEHASDQGSSNVELVKALVKHYISSPRAIIVATISCKDDMENQVRPGAPRAGRQAGRQCIDQAFSFSSQHICALSASLALSATVEPFSTGNGCPMPPDPVTVTVTKPQAHSIHYGLSSSA